MRFVYFAELVLGQDCREDIQAGLLKESCCSISWSRKMVRKMPLVSVSLVVGPVAISVEDLGFSGYTRIQAIYEQGQKEGLELCAPEVGPRLAIAGGLPKNEIFFIAMEPLHDESGFGIFEIGNKHLGARHGGSNAYWPKETLFIFNLP